MAGWLRMAPQWRSWMHDWIKKGNRPHIRALSAVCQLAASQAQSQKVVAQQGWTARRGQQPMARAAATWQGRAVQDK